MSSLYHFLLFYSWIVVVHRRRPVVGWLFLFVVSRRYYMECNNKDEGICLVMYQLTNQHVYPTEQDCKNCNKCSPPKTLNDFTRAKSSELLVKQGKPPLYKGYGPGTRLKRLLAWFIETPPDCDCEHRSQLMDAWGVAGCQANFSTIVQWLDEAALINRINITRMGIAAIVESVLITSWMLDNQLPQERGGLITTD